MVNASIVLWKRLAVNLVGVIGDDCFLTLLSSSVHETRKMYPWMMLGQCINASEREFSGLRECLEAQTLAESSAASASLLNAFIDVLIRVVGEPLTEGILGYVWSEGNPAA